MTDDANVPSRPYESLQDWMERTGTNTTQLAKLAGIGRSHLSYILTRSRRCSIVKAIRLSRVTGVPVEKLIEWKKVKYPSTSKRSFKSDRGKVA